MTTTTKTQSTIDGQDRPRPYVAHGSLLAALAAFQEEVPTIQKGNEATVASQKGSYRYRYADLSDVTEKALPLLGKHGLSFSTLPTQTKHGFALKYTLAHDSGEVIGGTYPLPPANTAPQQLGSAITYARRYTLCAVTGVAPGGDDDDAGAAQAGHERAQAVKPTARQRKANARKTGAPTTVRDWMAEAKAAATKDAADKVWTALRAEVQAGREPLALLDKVASVWRARKDANAQEQAGEPEAAPEPTTEPGAEAVQA